MSRIPVESVSSDMLARRSFVKLCATTAAAVSASPHLLAQAATAPFKAYARARLTDAGGQPITAATLAAGESLIFNYPYATTPCFLLNLGKPVTRNVMLRTESGAVAAIPIFLNLMPGLM